jgi:hypothetical protein
LPNIGENIIDKLQDFIDLIPEDKRDAFKVLAEKAVIINSREDVVNLRKTNPAFEAEFVNELRTKNEAFQAEFTTAKLPKLLDDEYRKRNPSKDPKDQQIEELQAKFADMERQAIIKDRKALAMQRLTEHGLSADLADFAIDLDEAGFNTKLEKITGITKSMIDAKVKEALTGAVGSQKGPSQGGPQTTAFSREALATPEGRKAYMEAKAKGLPAGIME